MTALPARSSSPVLVPRLELVPPLPDRLLEPEELDVGDLADLLASEQRRQTRGAWVALPAIVAAAALVLLSAPLSLQALGVALLVGATFGNLWLVRSSLDRECAELGVQAGSLRRVLARVYEEHARTTLRGLTGSARQHKVAELVRDGGRRRPRQLAALASSPR